jgi:thiamine pyrophosphate-dependent acetolactate synthase large subunit-like protein
VKVYQALAESFVREQTSTVFGLMGDANMQWMNAMSALGVEMVNVRHEGAGLAMADGWARVTGRPGVCTTTSGPGTAQLATTMLVASRAGTPLVAFCGDGDPDNRAEPQYLDQARFAAAIEAEFVRVASPEAAFDAVQRAFFIASSQSRPVLLSVPSEVQAKDVDLDPDDYVPSRSLLNKWRDAPNQEAVAAAAAIIAAGQRVVIVAGRGAVRSGAAAEVQRLAAASGALVATSLLAKGFAADDPFNVGIAGLYATRYAIELCQQADVVIGVGASLNAYTTEHGYLFPDARYVQVDTRPAALLGDGRVADCYVRADAALAADAIADALEAHPAPVGFRTPEVRDLLAQASEDSQPFDLDDGTLDPREVVRQLDRDIPDTIGLVLGSGHQVRFPTMLMNRKRPFVIAQHHFGCIGQGLTVGIGASLASDRAPVFTVEGDAGFMMHLAEFETAVRYRVPLLVVVMNDEAIGAEFHKSVASGLDQSLTLMTTPDLGLVGRSLGGSGALVRTTDELSVALADFVANPRPYLLDVRISRTVLSIPYRRLWYGEDV